MSSSGGASPQSESDLSLPESVDCSENLKNQFNIDYIPQMKLLLYSVDPPASPTSIHLYSDALDEDGHRLERCYLGNPTVPDSKEPDVNITLVGLLHGGIKKNVSQVWTASVTRDKSRKLEGKLVVAKFFDPLYYFDPDSGLDALYLVDESVYNEDIAYKKLRSLQGSKIPEFLGLFVAALPLPLYLIAACEAPTSRNVYVILLEYIDGLSLDKVQRKSNTIIEKPDKADRVCIMDDVLEVQAHIASLGVAHQDFYPRNLILRRSWKQEAGSKVVLIDFEDTADCDVSSEPWDPSEDAREKRIGKKRLGPDYCPGYPGWNEWVV